MATLNLAQIGRFTQVLNISQLMQINRNLACSSQAASLVDVRNHERGRLWLRGAADRYSTYVNILDGVSHEIITGGKCVEKTYVL
jgi:hypothetical protein